MTIPVEINGTSANFLVDTGSDCTIIDSAFAQRLGLKVSGTVSLERNYSTEERTTVSADLVRIGPATWTRASLVPLDLGTLSRVLPAPVAGVLGTDFLPALRIKLSYSSGTAAVAPAGENGGVLVPLRRVRKRYFVPVMAASSRLELLLDSGTNVTALSASAWESLPSSWKPVVLVEGIQSSGSPPGSFIACMPEMQVGDADRGDLMLRGYPLRVVNPAQSGSFAGAAFAGILGGDILARFEVTLDFQHASMYLKPDTAFHSDLYEFVTIGIQFFKADAAAFSVLAVWKHSPAEAAGVLVGDRILGVNGHSSASLELEAFAKQLHGPAGTPIILEVEGRPADSCCT